MKNKIATTFLLSVLVVTIVLSGGVHALVADEDTTDPQTSAPTTVEAPETVGEENNDTNIQNDYPLTQEYLDVLYNACCSAYGGEIILPETDGLHGPGAFPYTMENGRPMDSYVVHIPECYGRPGEDRPIQVWDNNGEVVEIPYDEIDPDLKQAVTFGYRRYQEILEGGKMVPIWEYSTGSYLAGVENYSPSASDAFETFNSVFQGKVVGISFEAKQAFHSQRFICKELYTVYDVEVINTYQGNVDARIQVKVHGGHPTYGIDEQRKAIDDIGLEECDIWQSGADHVLNLNETYLFTINVQYGISYIDEYDWGEIVISPDGLHHTVVYTVPFAFQPSTPTENGSLAVPSPNGTLNYENLMAYINSKSNEVDK